jgi:hypothetical protein
MTAGTVRGQLTHIRQADPIETPAVIYFTLAMRSPSSGSANAVFLPGGDKCEQQARHVHGDLFVPWVGGSVFIPGWARNLRGPLH